MFPGWDEGTDYSELKAIYYAGSRDQWETLKKQDWLIYDPFPSVRKTSIHYNCDKNNPFDLESATVSDIADQTYTGSEKRPTLTVLHDNVTLLEGLDYTLDYSDNTNAGIAKITITGIGYYAGQRTKTFKIKMPAGWYRSADKWYYFDTDGLMQTSWQNISGKWYFFNDQGIMQTGWTKVSGKWYYLNSSGAMLTGWQKISNTWYYFNPGGDMVTGWKQISGKWYYFNTSGAMVTGWQTISGKTYFFKSGGAMAANEWCNGWWLNSNGTWTYKYKGSWHQNSKGWWFGDESGWYAKNTTIIINDKQYIFDADGYLK